MTEVSALIVINITAFSYCFLLSSNITAFSYCFSFRYDLALRLSVVLSLFLLLLTIAFFFVCFVI